MNHVRNRTGRSAAARPRSTRRIAGMAVLAVVLGATGLLAAAALAGGTASQANATLALRQTGLGEILVNAKGRTLYLFMKDVKGRSACSGGCAAYWPPLTKTGSLTVGPGVKRALVGTTKRADGHLQVTYNKHPLYTFSLDSPGEAGGEGFSDTFGGQRFTWHAVVVDESGAPVTSATTTGSADDNVDYPGY